MPRYKLSGSFTLWVNAEDEHIAVEQLGELEALAEEKEYQLDYEIDDVDEVQEMERCPKCSKKVSSTELEQNNGTCYVCAHPRELGFYE